MLSILSLLSCDNNISSKNKSYVVDGYIVNEEVEFFIMNEEGFRSKPYKCGGGMLTIGYGTKAVSINERIDKEEGQKRLRQYLNNITYKKIERYNIHLSQNQLIAISSFDFNTDKLKDIIKDDKTIDCKKILLYDKIKVKNEYGEQYRYVVSDGLKKRRIKEYNLCIKK